jgi:branched-chain amino acid transport system permease protein
VTPRDLLPIIVALALAATLPLFVTANTVLNFAVFTLVIALAAQGWNILAGFGGQFSFGHAAFFGTGAYATALLQARFGINAWVAFAAGMRSARSSGGSSARSPSARGCAAPTSRSSPSPSPRSSASSPTPGPSPAARRAC